MADIEQQLIGTGVNMGIGQGLNAVGARLPVPLPNFYNPNSPNHFRDSQAAQMLHGDRRAWRKYAGKGIGGFIGSAGGPLGAMAGSYLGGHLSSLLTGHGWNDNKGYDTPRGEVTVGDINTDGSGGQTFINPDTGKVSYMPEFSNAGPYANGYQFGNSGPSLSDGGYNFGGGALPDFSGYGDYLSGTIDADGNPIPSGNLKEKKESDGYSGGGYGLSGVSNFMVGGAPVINGVTFDRYGGSGQGVYKRRDPGH